MNKVLQEMRTDPQGIIQRYGSHPQFKEVIYEFGKMWREHFAEMAKKEKDEMDRLEKLKEEAEEKLKNEGPWAVMAMIK